MPPRGRQSTMRMCPMRWPSRSWSAMAWNLAPKARTEKLRCQDSLTPPAAMPERLGPIAEDRACIQEDDSCRRLHGWGSRQNANGEGQAGDDLAGVGQAPPGRGFRA